MSKLPMSRSPTLRPARLRLKLVNTPRHGRRPLARSSTQHVFHANVFAVWDRRSGSDVAFRGQLAFHGSGSSSIRFRGNLSHSLNVGNLLVADRVHPLGVRLGNLRCEEP